MSMGSAMMSATVMRGLSELYGSWKMSFIFWRARTSASPESAVKSSPSSVTVPSVGSVRRRTHLPVVDLPQPDSPTMAKVSPLCSSKDTSSRAWTNCRDLPKRPFLMG